MKKTAIILLSVILIVSVTCVYASCASTDSQGPAPNYGDGVSDGSGFDRNDWPNEESPAIGPAPNAGDGFPDGSGF